MVKYEVIKFIIYSNKIQIQIAFELALGVNKAAR